MIDCYEYLGIERGNWANIMAFSINGVVENCSGAEAVTAMQGPGVPQEHHRRRHEPSKDRTGNPREPAPGIHRRVREGSPKKRCHVL